MLHVCVGMVFGSRRVSRKERRARSTDFDELSRVALTAGHASVASAVSSTTGTCHPIDMPPVSKTQRATSVRMVVSRA